MTLPGVPAQFEARFDLLEARGAVQPPIVAENRVVSPEYFATMRIPLLEGELCRRQPDRTRTEVMVNRTFAARYLSDRASAIGLHLAYGGGLSEPRRVAGVVADAREQGLNRDTGTDRVCVLQCAESHTALSLAYTWRTDGACAHRAGEAQGARTAPFGLRPRAARDTDRQRLLAESPPHVVARAVCSDGAVARLRRLVRKRRATR